MGDPQLVRKLNELFSERLDFGKNSLEIQQFECLNLEFLTGTMLIVQLGAEKGKRRC